MSTELLSPEVKSDSQGIEEDKSTKDLEKEIECPRCYDIMILSSNFDRLGYFRRVASFVYIVGRKGPFLVFKLN
jgi:hypothetical protein